MQDGRAGTPQTAPTFLTPRNRVAFRDRSIDHRRGTDDAADGGEGATTGCARPAHFTPARWFELAHRSIVPGVRPPSRREVTSRAGRTNLNPDSGSEANDDRLSCCRAAAHRSS